jgi:hypothetical protein
VVSGHHLLVIFSVKPLYKGKLNFKITPEVILEIIQKVTATAGLTDRFTFIINNLKNSLPSEINSLPTEVSTQ